MASKEQSRGRPIITHSFAAARIAPGEVWQVYLNAVDEEGDMKFIICSLEASGSGSQPTCFIRILEDQQRYLSGYIYLFTGGAQNLNSLNFLMRVVIQDKAGQYSEPVSFSLNFDPRAKPEAPPLGVFQDKELGPIMVDLNSVGIPPGP